MLKLVASGRKVHEVARDLGISGQTIYPWRRQERFDRGEEPGLRSSERAELTAARQRITERETELGVHRRATELLKESTGSNIYPYSGCATIERSSVATRVWADLGTRLIKLG